MNTTIITKAKELKKEGKYTEIVGLLKDYVKENPNDTDAFALYSTGIASTFYIDSNLNLEQLYGDVKTKYQGYSIDLALRTSSLMLLDFLALDHLDGKSTDEMLNTAYIVLRNEFIALGEIVYPYEVFKKQMDSYYSSITAFKTKSAVYYILSQFIDWESDLSRNILKYIVEKVKPVIETLKISTEDIYASYIEGVNIDIVPKFVDKPKLGGGHTVIKTEKEKSFWVGFFELLATTRKQELEQFRSIDADDNHILNSACSAWTYVYKTLSDCKENITSDAFLEGFELVGSIRVAEDLFTEDLAEASNLAKSISVSASAKIIYIIQEFVEKIKNFIKKLNRR